MASSAYGHRQAPTAPRYHTGTDRQTDAQLDTYIKYRHIIGCNSSSNSTVIVTVIVITLSHLKDLQKIGKQVIVIIQAAVVLAVVATEETYHELLQSRTKSK